MGWAREDFGKSLGTLALRHEPSSWPTQSELNVTASLTCARGHDNPNIAITCSEPGCGEWVVYRQVGSGRRTGWQIATITIGGLAALYLYRETADIWGSFAFLVLSLINLFLVTFSRGAAASAATVSTVLGVVGWGVWWWGTPPGAIESGGWRWAPVLLLIGGVLYAAVVGWYTSLETAQVGATYLVAMIAAVLGLWWAIAVSLESRPQFGRPCALFARSQLAGQR